MSIASTGDASGMHLSFVAFTSPTWLTITTSPTGTTPASITIAADPSGLATGVNNGQLTIVANNGSGISAIVPVTFTIGELGATPSSLSFTYQTGGVVPLPQSLAVTGPSTPVTFTATTSVTSGSNWLSVTPSSGTTPESLSVSLVSTVLTTLAAGTYNGQIVLTPSGSGASLTVPVTLTVTALPQLTASPASLAFNYQTGGTANVTQQMVSLTSPEGGVNFGAAATVTGGVQWLAVSPTSGVTPATLTATITPSGLTPGTYSGTITIVAPGTAGATITVSLLVSSSPLLSVSPAALAFTYQVGTPSPAAQSITTTSTGAAITYTVAATSTSGSWLSATGGGTTPNPISVAVNPAGLSAGSYTGTVTITAPNAGDSPLQIPVSLTVTNNALVEVAPIGLAFAYQIGKTVPANQGLAVTSTGGVLNYTAKASTTSGGNWLWIAPNMGTSISGSTPGTITVMVLTTGVQPGTYTGAITITATNSDSTPVPDSPVTIPVTYYVSNDALVQVDMAALSFTASTGGLSNGQNVNVTSTSDALNYTITNANGSPWLVIGAQSGTTPGSFPVVASAIGLASGTYTGSILVTATNPSGAPVTDSPLSIPVTFVVGPGALTAMPASLSFAQVVGGALPAPQTVVVGNSGSGSLNFTASASTVNGGNWLTVSPTSGSTGSSTKTLTVSVNSANLVIGTYTGNITITAPGATGSPQIIIPVTLTVQAVTISAAPASLTFNYTTGSPAPNNQTVAVTASSGSLSFTAAASTNGSSGNWLSVLPASGTTPANLNVAVNPTGLAVGTYTGTVTVTAAAGNSPLKVGVTLNVTPPVIPTPVIASITNAGSFALGPVAPGELVSIFGMNLGPVKGAYGTITNSMLSTEVSNIQVMFDSNPAPLLYVSAGQINAVVPFEVFGRSHTELTVIDSGVTSSALDLMVGTAAPGLFTVTQNGMGEGAILNQNSTVNSATNPAAKGSIIQVFWTGGGQTMPAGVTGHITPSDGTGLKNPVATVTATVGGLAAKVTYAGSAPVFVEGTMQVNLQMDASVASGPQPVVLTIGGVMSQSTATVAVQ